jgi:hypothetical protein
MPGLNSYAKMLSECQKLAAAVAANSEQLPGMEKDRERLEQSLSRFAQLLTRRDQLKVDSQVLSQELRDTALGIADQWIDMRSNIKATLGSRSEKLVEFKVTPRRKVERSERPRRRKATARKPAEPEPKADPPAGRA